jgi:hypothetical protein
MHGQQAKIGYDASVQSYFYEGGIGPGGNFAQDAQVWLDGIVIDGQHGGRPKLPAWRELYMRMYVLLNADFFSSQVTSWKMPGIGQAHGVWIPYPRDPRFSLGGYWDTGSTSGRGPITEGFGTIHQDKKGVWVYDEGSMRGAIGRPVDPKATEHPYKDLMPLGNSPYFHGMTAYDGGHISWPGVTLRRERWYCIEQYVKMNTIDTKKFTPVDAFGNYSWDAANADGQMKAWVDGRLVVDHTGFRFARNPAIGLRGLDGNWYFGGRALSTSQQSYKWRDVVIATKYIGPRRETTSARRAKSLPLWVPRPGELKVIPTKNTFESQNPHIPEFASEFHRIVDDFSGGVYNPYWGTLGCMVFHGGGHAATNDNSVVILDYDDLTFKRLSKPSLKAGDVDNVSGEYSDGQPGAAHTYDALAIAPPSDDAPAGTLVTPMRMAIGYHASVDSDFAHHMTLARGQERAHSARWRRLAKSDLAPLTPGGCCAYDTKRRRIWYTNAASQSHIRVIDLAKSAHQQIGIGKPTGETGPDAMTMRYDAQHDVLVLSAVREDGLARLMWLECATPSVGWRAAKISMDLPKHKYAASMPFDYVPELNRYVLLGTADREAVYEIEIPPNITELWRVTRRAFTGEVSIPVAYVSGKRWSYAPAAKAFLWLAAANGPLYSYRPYGT